MNTSNDQLVKNLLNDPYFHKWIIDPDNACLKFWDNWGDKVAERRECMNQARSILLAYKFKSTSVTQEETNMLWAQITERIEKPTTINSNHQKNNHRNWWYGVAAALALFALAFFTYSSEWNNPTDISEPEIGLIEKIAPEGKISSFQFEDGTSVRLFSGSIIRYPATFGEGSREVYLDGEGFFEVEKDPSRPFIVETNTLKTTALGTSFNIRTYGDGKCNVSLVTGKVKVEMLRNIHGRKANALFLDPGEEATMELDAVLKQSFNIEETTSWKDGYIYLENKSFDETINILQRWFKVDFEVKNRAKVQNNLQEKKGNGTFKNQSLENILKVVGHSFEFTYEIKDNTVILTF